ncbi:MAG: hypothetical protein AB8G23_06825 [Myxococcota bacterium]
MRNFSRAHPDRTGLVSTRLTARRLCLGMAFVCMAALACVDPTVEAGSVSARIVSAGEYSLGAGVPVLAGERTLIPCETGRVFGVDYSLEVEGGAFGAIPVSFRWVHPEMQVDDSPLRGTETSGGGSNPVIGRGQSALSGRSLWSIDREEERISGEYRFEIRFLEDRRLLLSQDFQIDDC